MKQCKRCYRFLSDIIDRCLYCKHTELKQLDFISSPLNDVIEIYFHDIVVDDQAYNIIKLLGKGGFGTVIQVSDPTDKKLYAMKVPLIFDEIFTNKKGNQEEEIKRSQKFLEKEIELFLKYRDETFLCFYKKGTARSSLRGKTVSFPVLIMELAQGTVKDIIKYEKESNKVSEDEKVKIIREIVNSISNLHGKGVLHRDLSPDNLFVVDRGGRISYVLGDLGACKDLYKDYSKGISSEILLGHRPYIDPCRFYKEYKNDHRNDVYSLGIIITEILLGKFWPDFLKIEDIPHVLNFDFENEFLLRYGIKFIRDQEIIEVLRKALKKDIKERYRSIDDFRKTIFKVLIPFITPIGPSTPPQLMESKKEIFDFYFTLRLPFSVPEQTYSQTPVQYRGGKKLTLSDYQGTKITFDGFSPTKALIKGTSLYSVTIADNTLLLNFKNSEFFKLLKIVKGIDRDMQGELHFKGMIEVEGDVL